MKNAVHSRVGTLKDTWHLGRQMSHLSVQTKLDGLFKPALLRSKQVQLLSLLSMNKYIDLLRFLSALLTSLNFQFICVPNFYFLLGRP
jgi:hypothetical protein